MKFQCFWLLLTYFAINKVNCLKCYANNMDSLTEANLPLYELKDCKNVIEGQEIDLANTHLMCYKIVLGSMHELGVKGCIPKGGCPKLQEEARVEHSRHPIECYECGSDGCNSAPKNKVFILYAFTLTIFALVL